MVLLMLSLICMGYFATRRGDCLGFQSVCDPYVPIMLSLCPSVCLSVSQDNPSHTRDTSW